VCEADDIDLVVTAAVPSGRSAIAVRALPCGQARPGCQAWRDHGPDLAAVGTAVAESGRRWWVLFSERFENRGGTGV
jgi:hypothetical protein